jgi:hypothetical protein
VIYPQNSRQIIFDILNNNHVVSIFFFRLLPLALQFVAHPNIQQLLASLWYEGMHERNNKMRE